jgi:hemin uptake protein HemP
MNVDAQGFRISVEDELRRCFDQYAHAFTVINEPHRLVHDGMLYNASGKVNVANGANLDILLQFPAGVIGHMTLIEYQLADAPCDAIFYENPTFSAAGTAVNVKNHNRLSTRTANVTITHTPTITGVGDLIMQRFLPAAAGAPGLASGQLVRGEDSEWIIGNGNDYLWRLTNNSGAAIDVGFHFDGYILDYES